MKGRAVIVQSGGPTRVINQSLVGAILESYNRHEITEFWGSLNGPEGIIDEKFIDLYKEDRMHLMRVARTPSAALGSSRKKIGTGEGQIPPEQFFEALKENDIRFFFYIGGNDSADNALSVKKIADDNNYEMKVFHIPKTIDNDLRENDHTPGYGSAARFIVGGFLGDGTDNYSLKGVKINVLMGRDAGWLTAASSLARNKEGDPPHLIYVPEVDFNEQFFINDVQSVFDNHGRAVIAVSEGIRYDRNRTVAKEIIKNAETDSHGNEQLSGTGALGDYLAGLIKENTNIGRVRADTYGYLQRCFAGDVSNQDAEEAEAVGRQAIVEACGDLESGSIVIRRKVGGPGYDFELACVPLDKVARVTRPLDQKYISQRGNNIKPEFADYALPLLGKGMPRIDGLEMHLVK